MSYTAPQSAMILFDAVTTEAEAGRGRLARISVEVRAGSVQAVVAEDTACTAAILDLLIGRLHPVSGTVSINTVDPVADPRGARQQLGLVSARGLDGRVSVRDNARAVLRLCGRSAPSDSALEHAFREAEIADRLFDTPASRLRPRDIAAVWLAIASLRKTPAVVCHQLGAALGAVDARRLARLLRSAAARGHAVLILDRETGLARRAADRVSTLRRGRLLAHAGDGQAEPGLGAGLPAVPGDES